MARPTAALSEPPPPPAAVPSRRDPIGWIVAASLSAGAVAVLVLLTVVVAGAPEHVITGTALLGFALGWALLAVLSSRTSQPQRWAVVPAAGMGLTGAALVLLAPGERAMGVLGWVWPPALLALAGWMLLRARRHLRSWTRTWLLHPVCVVTALAAVAGGVETVRGTLDPVRPAAEGRLYDVGGHRLYLECSGSGSPTVVLANGFTEHTPSWAWVAPAVARDTRVCTYDRAGLGWSEPASGPQDGIELADDLHALLAAASVPGPYVLAGHSVGGAYDLVFTARYPTEVAGMVLLDSSSPDQFSLPDFPRAYELYRRASAVFPPLARLGLGRVTFGAGSSGLPPDARTREQAIAASAAELRGQRDEWSQLPAAFAQARRLTGLGSKPLVVLTAGRGQQRGWSAAQAELAALSSDSVHRTVQGATHAALLADRRFAAHSSRAIRDVVRAVRTGAPLRP
jgi:pimeloyl-ACP methyl ester carboxylesterase